MTTTLRPSGPEQPGPDGHRSRDYQVCVNSRPVGAVRLGTDPRFGPSVGRVQDLRIEEPDRRRGRGTVAALAAEEVLRGWGCRRIEVSVPADAVAALRLVEVLGYRERARGMVKRVPAHPPPLAEGSAGRAMTEREFRVWQRAEEEGYAQSLIAHGVPAEQARAKSAVDQRTLLPREFDTPGAVLRHLVHRGVDVGTLWLALGRETDAGPGGYVFDVQVTAGHRGQGHGRSLMLLAEHECRAAGMDLLGLTVFPDNTPALRLYQSLGYRPTRHHLAKPLI